MKYPARTPTAIVDLVWAIALVLVAALMGSSLAHAQSVARTEQQRTQEAGSHNSYTTLSDRDRLLGQHWGLSNEEMTRAKVLLEGPRKSFSVENLSPHRGVEKRGARAGCRRSRPGWVHGHLSRPRAALAVAPDRLARAVGR